MFCIIFPRPFFAASLTRPGGGCDTWGQAGDEARDAEYRDKRRASSRREEEGSRRRRPSGTVARSCYSLRLTPAKKLTFFFYKSPSKLTTGYFIEYSTNLVKSLNAQNKI